jgi:anti-sigma regulatory factor (Ser/Thr protein kinase)
VGDFEWGEHGANRIPCSISSETEITTFDAGYGERTRGTALTTIAQETPNPENTIARVAVADDPELVPTVVDFARSVTGQAGLEAEAARRLGQTLGEVCRNVIAYAFAPGEARLYEVEILRRPGRVVVAVEDMGLPFDYSHLGEIADQEVFGGSFVDEVRLLNLGRGGNRVELVKLLPHADIREHVSEDEHRRTVQAPPVPEDASYEIRPMRPEESPSSRVASTAPTATATTGTTSTTRTGSASCRRGA